MILACLAGHSRFLRRLSCSQAQMQIYYPIQGHQVLVLSLISLFSTTLTYSYQYDPRAFSGNLPASWPAFEATYQYLEAELVCQRAFNSTDRSHGSYLRGFSSIIVSQYFLLINATTTGRECLKMVGLLGLVIDDLELCSNIVQIHQLQQSDQSLLSHYSLMIQEQIVHFLSMGSL